MTSEPLEIKKLPILPLRDIVVFPNMIVPLFVGRERSVKALEKIATDSDQHILLVTQKDASQDNPSSEDLYKVGTFAQILQLLKLPDGTVKVLVEGLYRANIIGYSEESGYLEANAVVIDEIVKEGADFDALLRTAVSLFEQYLKLNPKIPPDVITSITKIEHPGKLADTIASHLTLKKISDKQSILEISAINERLEKLCEFMGAEISVLQVEKRIRSRVKRQMEKSQRDYYLTEQLKAIQKELSEIEDGRDELSELEKKIEQIKFSKEAREKATSELKKLRSMSPMASEATVVRNYLDWLLGIPWKNPSKIKKDIQLAEKILNQDHYGLDKVKERILEYLAVQNRVGKVKGPILCLVGPPGVGKTSLGQSIAKSTGRQFVRISLGGVRDEAEIRGHRRTYIGSMPGKIVQGMKKAKASNPLFLLDEIDKLGADWRGDPTSALLEVLDPEQNTTFNDHYLEVDYDLSDVMFVTTANSLNMPQPLLDRLEIIRLAGYTEDEKLEIALRHLLPKQLKLHGIKKKEWAISEDALRKLIRNYTREAGVRNLEREIANLLRKALKELESKKKKAIKITTSNLSKYAGIERYQHGVTEQKSMVGVTTGLAWTEVGGEILMIEAVMLPGKGKAIDTGKLGDVMKESVQAAWSFVRSRGADFGVEAHIFENNDIHVHVPEGATPKDGPSAGTAIFTSMVSVLTGIPVKNDVAMTGEITLRGRVLAIGGLKEKLLAAHRSGIKTVLIPEDNQKDLAEIPNNIKKGLKIIPVKNVEDVLTYALAKKVKPIIWTKGKTPVKQSSTEDETVTAH
jgi:ATP-dependent Lon protease